MMGMCTYNSDDTTTTTVFAVKLFFNPDHFVRYQSVGHKGRRRSKNTVLYSSLPYTLLQAESVRMMLDAGLADRWIAGGSESFYYAVWTTKRHHSTRKKENTMYLKLAIQKAETNVA